MPRRPREHPPRQARSRETLRRLLDAAETVLDRYGLEGATLPRIARVAGIAPATVYRRFRDKDALLAAVFRRFSDIGAAETEAPLDAEAIRRVGLEAIVGNWTRALISAHRDRRGLLRATMEYTARHRDAPFVKRQIEVEGRGFDKMATLLLLFRDRMRHPHPEFAVRWAMLLAGAVVRDRILSERGDLIEGLVPVSVEQLGEELAQTILRYLGVSPPQTPEGEEAPPDARGRGSREATAPGKGVRRGGSA